jgi:presenilin-like A22 family membrane protease
MAQRSSEPSRPGPRDRSAPLFSALAGAIVGIVLYILKLGVAPAAAPENVLVFVMGGALAGFVVALIRARRHKEQP